jgi:farnesyl diphosphate synthase
MKAAMDEPRFDMAARLAGIGAATERLLDELLGERVRDHEIARPAWLLAAMRHGALSGGKRLRPFLVVESAQLFGGDFAAALRVAAALECIHCYSLVHDDLPAMDDYALRRGIPTVHVAFDEATAILVGDALQTLAFEVIASPETELPAEAKVALVLALARAAGLGGMVGGQALDLAAEHSPPDEAGIIQLQAMKTGALIRIACEAGAIVATAPAFDRERLCRFGEAIGVAFQLADDLLDVTASAEELGKATGKDAERGKGTLVALHGVDWARRQLAGLVGEATELLTPYGSRAEALKTAARFIAERRN